MLERPIEEEPEALTNLKEEDFPEEDEEDLDKRNNNFLPSSSSTSATSLTSNESVKTEPIVNGELIKKRTLSDIKRDFQLGDVVGFVNKGLQSIIDDDVTKRFTTEELTVWNLLSRTNQQYEYVSFRITILWLFGLMLRYCILFPFR